MNNVRDKIEKEEFLIYTIILKSKNKGCKKIEIQSEAQNLSSKKLTNILKVLEKRSFIKTMNVMENGKTKKKLYFEFN